MNPMKEAWNLLKGMSPEQDPRIQAHREYRTSNGVNAPRRAEKQNPEDGEPYQSYYGGPYGGLNSVEGKKLKRVQNANQPVYTEEKKPQGGSFVNVAGGWKP